MPPKGANAKGKGKGKAKDTSDAGEGKDDNKKGGKGLKAANSINVRHILVCIGLSPSRSIFNLDR